MRYLAALWLALILSLSLQAGSATSANLLPVHSFSSGNLTAHILDVGQGDSILIQFKGKNILIDGGERDMGPRVQLYLLDYGVSKIDLLVATHPHSDHIGGLLNVIDKFQVSKVLDSGQPHTSKTYEDFLTRIDQKDIPYQVAEAGQRIELHPDLDVEILSPPEKRLSDDLNENSVVLRIAYGKVAFLLMGDAGYEAENEIMSKGFDIESDILKVGHHGSKSATSASFLKRVAPRISIISAGLGNPYGHPAPEVIKRLKKSGSQVYRTDIQGTIDVTTDGTSIYVSTREEGKAAKPAAARQKAEA
jgi:competence protein ComEC